ncbi:hypothetical protein [Novosphingobium sp.]|uniref:hypothetical protein n=1 Tax=Novosphingobium sp. TaxID=1874826 RepID=UPI0022C1547A|nr:hypothetical protein [Novosphingobium sp.]MCZ8020113.1 hypothetical protein [Novosphingobium sp.]MCZ8035758.1 hypothetical protein [Novosphingobium sp.]MCZ8053156.1 hypothetical protein [Novosphingobium sp.]MCZ8061153.1 hypothetical protein [Novosphingobium sp.]MCZ8230882.1 hypothetical protein [Novosphingobium sp.]
MIRALALALLAPLLVAAKPAPDLARDFARASTPQAVAALAERGQLVKIYLFPLEVGGPEDPMNVAWVTPAALRQAEAVTDKIIALLEQGKVDSLDVQPEYKGDSRIPSRIRYIATHKTGPAKLDRVVEVW